MNSPQSLLIFTHNLWSGSIISHSNLSLFTGCAGPQTKPMAVAPPTAGHSPSGANVRVGHTSFIHGDGTHFASSRAISESIKNAINFERTKRKEKMLVLLITVAGSQTQTNHSRIGSTHQRRIQRALSRLQQNPFPHMVALKITAGDTLPQILRLQMRSRKRIINIVIYLFFEEGWFNAFVKAMSQTTWSTFSQMRRVNRGRRARQKPPFVRTRKPDFSF